MNKDINDITRALGELVGLTEDKKKHLEAIYDLTQKQSEVLDANQVDKLMGYIEEKQVHIDAIGELDDRFGDIYESIRDDIRSAAFVKGNSEASALYARLRALVSDVQKMMKDIYDLEQKNSKKLKQVRDEIGRKIRQIKIGKKGYEAYRRPQVNNEGIFIDKKR